MSDSVREALQEAVEYLNGDHGQNSIGAGSILHRKMQAALSANGGEAGEIIHVGFTNPAQIGYAKDESGFFYPDTDNQCYIPLYMLKRHLNRMGHDYTHPAPPSVAVPAPSMPENDNCVSSAYDSGYLDAMLYARVCCGRLDNPENTKDYRDCARFLDLIFKSEIDEAARLRTTDDEGEE